jgi:tetratricopeptide (TPR) repeat protein
MSIHHLLRSVVLMLAVTIAGSRVGSAEPTAPIPQAAKDLYARGQELERQGKLKEAVAAYQEAIRLGMQMFPKAYLKEAGGYLGLQDYDIAIAKYTKFIDSFGLEDSCRY